jgi:branched-chain amino acid transport system substrate-binding protein
MSSGSKPRSVLRRRAFLKAVASTGAAMAAESLFLSAAHARIPSELVSSKAFKIGVVLPESRVYPALAASLLAGLRLAFAQRGNLVGGRPVALLPATYGERIGDAAKHARALVLEQDVDLLVGVMSSVTTASLSDLLESQQVPLIVTNVGANVVRPYGQSPLLFRASLNDWQASWATGAWAANQVGKNAFITTSFYESGYDSTHMFERGLERAGGAVVGRSITHQPRVTDTFAPMLAAVKQTSPDLVYAAYSGPQAIDFMRAYADAGLAGRIPLVGSGFLFDESLLRQHGQAALGSISGSAWAAELDTPENIAFTSAYRAATGQPADPFAVLGYDAAKMIAQAVDATPHYARGSAQLLDSLRASQLRSPRGDVIMNHETQIGSTPFYIREVRQVRGSITNAVVARLDPIAGLDKEAIAIRASAKSGWLNAYLAV